MLRLRPFKKSDMKYLLEWMKDEKQFSMWCANLFQYPLTEEQLVNYQEDFEKDESSWIFSALNEEGIPVGHFMMKRADYVKQSIRIGFVILNPECRGKGYGKEMLQLAVTYATELLKFQKVTLGVFDNNPAAHRCYQAVGFRDQTYEKACFPFKDEKWGAYEMLYQKE